MKLHRRIALGLVPAFVPFAAWWVRTREQEVIARGASLAPAQMDDARAAGIARPDCVRLLRVETIPTFTHPLLMPLGFAARPIFAQTAGITLGYGIAIRAGYWGNRRLLAHELAHVAQYERLGGIAPFLHAYLRECIVDGYPHGALEQEASSVAARVCSLGSGG